MARKIIKQTSSFGVLRANPRISGNIKITVDSGQEIWLNSIDSNPEMSNSMYKGFKIPEGSSFEKDLYTFFNNGKTPSQFVFGMKGEGETVQNQLKDISGTYDFTYSSGITPLVSDRYPEDFTYLAPLWIGEDLPDYFVIFKVNDPIDYLYQVPVTRLNIGKTYKVIEDLSVDKTSTSYTPFKVSSFGIEYIDGDVFDAQALTFTVIQGKGSVVILDPLYHLSDIENIDSHFRDKILNKATAVATFDLTENSKIGKYLRKIKTTPGYTDSLIDVRFEENQLTTYNGVNYEIGIFDKKGDYLLDYFQDPEPQIAFEDFITDGFRKNGIISYKLLNLEFLFNDNDSDNYSINRYFGLYVNAPEMATFRLDGNALFKDQGLSGNTPVPERNDKGYSYQDTSYFQYNDNGVRIFIDNEYVNGIIPNSDNVNINESSKLFWIKDKNGKFHSFKRNESYTALPVDSIYGISGCENQIVIQDKSIDLSLLSGIDSDTKKQYPGVSTGERGRAYSVIKIGDQLTSTNGDAFIFYHPLGTYGNIGEKYDVIKCSDLSVVIDEWGPGSFYVQDNAYYIHPFGTNADIAKAIAGIFNNFPYNSFEAFSIDNEVVIRIKATGYKENSKYSLDFYQDFTNLVRMPDTRRGTILINEKDVCDINRKQNFIGGSDHYVNRVKVKIEDANKITIGETFLETIKNTNTDTFKGLPGYSNKGASIVVGKYRFIDEYSRDNNQKIIGLKDFQTHATLEVETFIENISLGSIGKISAFNVYNIPIGIFSFYGLRELDMDFWYSEYGYTPTQEYYRHLDTQPDGITKIQDNRTYYIAAGTTISYSGSIISGPEFFKGIDGYESYELLTSSTVAESNVYPTLSTRNNATGTITPSSFDSLFYPDLDSFPGFYGIQELKFIDNKTIIESKNYQLMFGKLDSEYDYTKDNYNSQFAIKSRVSPYITKWAYRGGTDVRGNEYRLNSNIAFSPLNFSPSFFRRAQDPQYFTHEWYQLQKPPFSLPEKNLYLDKSYLSNNDRLGNSKDISELLSEANPASRDNFLDYFSIEGEDLSIYYQDSSTIESVNLTERYSTFDYNEGSQYLETLFRGAKVRIKKTFTDYLEGQNVKYNSENRFYEGYKFSCVIVPVENQKSIIQSPFKIRVIENRTFKNITFIIEVLIDDVRAGINPENKMELDYFLLYSLKDKLDSDLLNIILSSTVSQVDLPIPGDIKLSAALNISATPTSAGLYSSVNTSTEVGDGIIYILPNPDYQTDLREEISLLYLPTVNGPTGSTGPGSFYGNYTGSTAPYTFPYPVGVGENYINFNPIDWPDPYDYRFNFEAIGLPSNPGPLVIPISTTSVFYIKNIPIYQRQGGIGYWKNILEKISFANISLLINSKDPYIEYKSYVWDEVTKTTNVLYNEFALEFLKPSAFEQKNILIPEENTNKPQELFPFFIGYTLNEIPGETELYRYSGEYIPKFREILKFENVKYDIPSWMTKDPVIDPNSRETYYKYNITVTEKNESSNTYDIGSQYCIAIDGEEQKQLVLIKGVRYIFDLSDASNLGYTLYFSENNRGNSIISDALMEGYELVGTPGQESSYITFTVPYNFPDNAYYVAEGGKYMGQKIKVIDPIEYSYCTFGASKDNFGLIKNLNYYKYGEEWIFRIGKNSPYNPVYNLIGETPVDKRDISLFESSWDPGFYRQYTGPQVYTSLPGTRNMKEEKSFFGSKVMQTPDSFNSQKQLVYPTSIEDVFNINYDNYPNYEIFWENTKYRLNGVLLLDRIITRYFLENGGKKVFDKFVLPEFGYGDTTNVDDDFNQYMKLNVIPIFECKNNGTYIKKVPTQTEITMDPIIGNLANYQKLINGYYLSKDIQYTKVNDLRYEFSITKDPSFNYSLCFSIDIGKI